jgi:hypothetical protein
MKLVFSCLSGVFTHFGREKRAAKVDKACFQPTPVEGKFQQIPPDRADPGPEETFQASSILQH